MNPKPTIARVASRMRGIASTRKLRLVALPLTVAALAAPIALPATAAASAKGCTQGWTGQNVCLGVNGGGMYVKNMTVSIPTIHAHSYESGRLHVWGPGNWSGGFQLKNYFTVRTGWWTGSYSHTWTLNRRVAKKGNYCGQFEVNYGHGWVRAGNGPACVRIS